MVKTYRPSDIKDVAERVGWWQEHTTEVAKREEDKLDQYAMAYERMLRGDLPPRIMGGIPTPVLTLGHMTGAGVLNTTWTTAQSIVSASATPGPAAASEALGPFNVDYFKTLGAAWEQKAMGVISTTVTPTIAFGTYYGVVAGTITTVLCISPTITTASGLANINWYWLAMGRTIATSLTTATILSTGILFGDIEALAATVAGEPIQYAVNATPPTAVTVDMSSIAFLDLKATWGTSNVANAITTNFYVLTSLYS